ncbi:hypothetical protein A9R00_06645 [Oleispira antarctica]|uniref:DUF4124 domain-containing protein n=1 Tax=Oleispira antarctica TaxID=188908 RepID=A0A1Y5HSM4_OLEAN|nr:hypothetical protein A9R00_06645 [Oleispira antarctica]
MLTRAPFYALLFLLMSSISYATEVYISVDDKGNRVFSDQPSKESRKHKVKEISIIPAIEIPAKVAVAEPDAEVSYQVLAITTPRAETDFTRDKLGSFGISAQVSPSLQDTDEAVLFINGVEIEANSTLSWQRTNTDRGEHSLQVIVRDKETKTEKISSQAITIYVRR